jgi:hypothetical protein
VVKYFCYLRTLTVIHIASAYCLFFFGAGFRSRVKYINILDPTNMCFYISEILDAGRNSPLFMVSW